MIRTRILLLLELEKVTEEIKIISYSTGTVREKPDRKGFVGRLVERD
jgi:hypothetical protein